MNARTIKSTQIMAVSGSPWPDGHIAHISGDIHTRDASRPGALQIHDQPDAAGRAPTPEEHRAVWIAQMAEIYAQRDVIACQSWLIDNLLRCPGDVAREYDLPSYDDVINLAPDPSEWTCEQCHEYLDDIGGYTPDYNPWAMTREELVAELEALYNPWAMTREELVAEIEALGTACYDEEPSDLLADALATSVDAGDVGDLEAWRDAVTDQAQPAEVLEWWLVSRWLADELIRRGHAVLDTSGPDVWWGRTTTGQGYLMDGVLQEIAASHYATH